MKTALFLIVAFAIAGCTMSRSPSALVRSAGKRGYEIVLSRSSFGLGGPCTFPFDPAVYDEHFCIFTRHIHGVVPAERLQLFYPRPSEEPWVSPQSALRGQITFSSLNALDVRLFVPRYNGNTLTQHVEFEMNGHYAL